MSLLYISGFCVAHVRVRYTTLTVFLRGWLTSLVSLILCVCALLLRLNEFHVQVPRFCPVSACVLCWLVYIRFGAWYINVLMVMHLQSCMSIILIFAAHLQSCIWVPYWVLLLLRVPVFTCIWVLAFILLFIVYEHMFSHGCWCSPKVCSSPPGIFLCIFVDPTCHHFRRTFELCSMVVLTQMSMLVSCISLLKSRRLKYLSLNIDVYYIAYV